MSLSIVLERQRPRWQVASATLFQGGSEATKRCPGGLSPNDVMYVLMRLPCDTWFGTSTTGGELCYATRTKGRLKREDLPVRLHRAITPDERGIEIPFPHRTIYTGAETTPFPVQQSSMPPEVPGGGEKTAVAADESE